MRYLLLALLPLLGWGQGGAPVEGIVTSSATHMGLAGVSVSVVATTGRRITYNTTTNADGSFRIGSIDQEGEFKAEFLKRGFRGIAARSSRHAPLSLIGCNRRGPPAGGTVAPPPTARPGGG